MCGAHFMMLPMGKCDNESTEINTCEIHLIFCKHQTATAEWAEHSLNKQITTYQLYFFASSSQPFSSIPPSFLASFLSKIYQNKKELRDI